MAKRLNWTDEQLNCYGFWVKTEGIDMTRFDKNPIMLFNHHRTMMGKTNEILPVGKWKEYRKEEGGGMSGVPVFDMKDEFAAKIANKVEGDFLTACSIGVRIIETSGDPQYLKEGQTRPTVIKCELREVSVVDIPSNPHAAGIVLYDKNDNVIELSDDGDCPLGLINNQTNRKMKNLASFLGLSDNASEADILAALSQRDKASQAETASLKAAKEKAEQEITALKAAQKAARDKEAVELVDAAVDDGRISADLKADYLEMFASNFDKTKKILASMSPVIKLGDMAGKAPGGCASLAAMSWDELDRKGLLPKLRDEDPDLYQRKYKEMAAGVKIERE